MTEFVTRTVRCPLCATEFTHDQPVAPAVVGRDSDLRPRYEGADPLPAQLLACPTCRYAAYAEGFEPLAEIDEEERLLLDADGPDRPRARSVLPDDDEVSALRRLVKTREYLSGLPEGEPFGAARYVLAARCHEFLVDDDLDGAADLYLRASWCARAHGQMAIERRCQAEAVERLQKRLAQRDPPAKLSDADRVRALYLVAELSRRQGAFTAAFNGFEQLKGAVDAEDDDGQLWLERARRLSALVTVKSAVDAPWTDAPDDDEPET